MKTAISGFLLLLLYSLAQSGVVPAPMEEEELRAYIDNLVKHFHDDPDAAPAPQPSSRRRAYARPPGKKYPRPIDKRVSDAAKTPSKAAKAKQVESVAPSRKSRMLTAETTTKTTTETTMETTTETTMETTTESGADRRSRKLKKEIQDINTDLDTIDQAVSDMAGGESAAPAESGVVEAQKIDEIKTDLAMINDVMTDLIEIEQRVMETETAESGKDVGAGAEQNEEMKQLDDIKSHLDDIVQAMSPGKFNAPIEDIQKDIVDIEQAVSDMKEKSENIIILEIEMESPVAVADPEAEQSEKPDNYLDQFLKKSLEIFQMGSMMTRTFLPGIFGPSRLSPAQTFDSNSVLDLMKPTSAPSRRSRKNTTVIHI